MVQYNVTGMTCAACVNRVEKAVNKVPGVTSCAVSLLTNSMGVDGTASSAEIIAAVEAAGYGASVKGNDSAKSSEAPAFDEDSLADKETPKLKRRLIASVGFVCILMYFSMGHMMWGWPIPSWFHGNHVAMGLLQLLLATIVMVINQKFFINGFKSTLHGSPNMDALVALGSGASYLWSIFVLFLMTDAVAKGNDEMVMVYMDEFYFESAAMILALITVGKMLESMSKGRTTDALKSLMKLAPKTAVVLKDGKEVTVPIEQVKQGDIFVVRPGENVPVDGVVLEGNSAINESALTGESIPVDKAEGDLVSAATINQSGYIKCQATRVGQDTTLSQIIQMVSDAAATKAPISRIADQVSGIFVPVVIVIAVIVTAIWLFVGETTAFALARGISVLVISCPCALGLATPVAIMVGNGMGAKNGILFKTSQSLEEAGKVQIVALDKTGTITKGEPQVTDMIPAEGFDETKLLTLAYALEKKSEHPLAKAVIAEGDRRNITAGEVTDFAALPGNGLSAVYEGKTLFGGNLKMMSERVSVSEEMKNASERLAEQGKTPLFFGQDNSLMGIIAVADVIKEDSPRAIKELQNMGIKVIMLTGDNERTAKAIGAQAGVDEVVAGVLPDGKESVIRALKEKGKVAMVGDGINDAPALTRADTGIAIGAGTDVAIDAADVVLMKSRLSDVSAAIRLSRETLKNIKENLFWAFFYNVICIPLAAGAYIKPFGLTLNPMVGAAAMSLSSFCVVMNALRLNLFNVRSTKHDKKIKNAIEGNVVEQTVVPAEPVKVVEKCNDSCCAQEEVKTMIIKIDGMTCSHCEATVKELLESFDGVVEASASHEAKQAVVKYTKLPDMEAVAKAITEEDYEYLGVEMAEEAKVGTMIVKIDGMMCGHCEATIKELLEGFDGVVEANASHEAKQAVVKYTSLPDMEAVAKAITEEDYEYLGMEIVEEASSCQEKVLSIEGMMCGHCEATVKEVLEAIDGIESVVADHEKAEAKVVFSGGVDEDVIRKALAEEDYEYKGMK